MFRVVTRHTPKPLFFLMCDHSNCTQAHVQEVPAEVLSDQVEQNKKAQGFVQARTIEGWVIGLEAHYCPACIVIRNEQIRLAKEREQLIVEPTGMDVAQVRNGGKRRAN